MADPHLVDAAEDAFSIGLGPCDTIECPARNSNDFGRGADQQIGRQALAKIPANRICILLFKCLSREPLFDASAPLAFGRLAKQRDANCSIA